MPLFYQLGTKHAPDHQYIHQMQPSVTISCPENQISDIVLRNLVEWLGKY